LGQQHAFGDATRDGPIAPMAAIKRTRRSNWQDDSSSVPLMLVARCSEVPNLARVALMDKGGREFVESAAGKPGIFISYARSDSSALADELVAGLEFAGFRPFLDRHDIAAAEDWEARLGALILGADTVVFILSPAAVKSPRCKWEVERAAELGKRLIPVEGAPVPEADVPERLRRLNYIFFREGHSFARPLRELADALRQDVEWIREHTRLSEAAARWEARDRGTGAANDLLLRGDELADARAWVARRKENAP